MDLEEVLEEEELDEEAENPDIRTDENGIKKIQYEVNDVLKLRIEDKNQETGKELETYMEEKREILENILKVNHNTKIPLAGFIHKSGQMKNRWMHWKRWLLKSEKKQMCLY